MLEKRVLAFYKNAGDEHLFARKAPSTLVRFKVSSDPTSLSNVLHFDGKPPKNSRTESFLSESKKMNFLKEHYNVLNISRRKFEKMFKIRN